MAVQGINGSQANQTQQIGNNQDDIKKKLEALGIPANVIAQGREAVGQYAEQNNIQLPGAPQKSDTSGSIFGQKGTQKSDAQKEAHKEEMKQKLEAMGVPDSVIEQGKDAVKTYAQQNGISLPEPPQKPQGSNLNFDA